MNAVDNKAVDSTSLFKELWASFFKGNGVLFVANTALAIPRAALSVFGAYCINLTINLVAGQSNVTFSKVIAFSIVLFIFEATVYILKQELFPRFLRRASVCYKERLCKRLFEKGIGTIGQNGPSRYLSALTNDVTAIETGYLEKVFDLIRDVALFVGTILLMTSQNPTLTLAAILLGALPFAVGLATGNKLAVREREVSDDNEHFVGLVSELLQGFLLIKSFRAEPRFVERFRAGNRQLEDAKFRKRRLALIIQGVSQYSHEIAQVGVTLFGAWLALTEGSVTAGMLVMFLQLMNYIFLPVEELPSVLAARKAARELVRKAAASLGEHTSSNGTHELSATPCEGIRAQSLTFAYEKNQPVLSNLTVRFDAGSCTALVGGSGSGKSTLLSLIMGELTGYDGSLCYDSCEISDATSDSLLGAVSLVSQDVFIFDGSIEDNITMFEDADPTELERAIQLSGLAGFVAAHGLDYPCGVGGSGLSGGERQRVSIARALLRGTGTLLLDEATSALDQQTADLVTRSVLSLANVTRIVVTHRLDAGLLKRFDAIVVLRDGRVCEQGTFDELMAGRGYFHALYTVSQTEE